MRIWWNKIQEEAFLLIFHDVIVSTFKFGGNRRFFGVSTANFGWCRDVRGPSHFLLYPTSLSQTLFCYGWPPLKRVFSRPPEVLATAATHRLHRGTPILHRSAIGILPPAPPLPRAALCPYPSPATALPRAASRPYPSPATTLPCACTRRQPPCCLAPVPVVGHRAVSCPCPSPATALSCAASHRYPSPATALPRAASRLCPSPATALPRAASHRYPSPATALPRAA